MKTPQRRTRKRAASPLSTELTLAITAALEKKALDVVVLDLRKSSAFTDFFVVCTGANTRQVAAIAESVESVLTRQGVKPALVEGLGRSEWVLMDYFDFIVHVFTPATREFYALERLWGDAERVDVSATATPAPR
jgi:ribosome-associated protein